MVGRAVGGGLDGGRDDADASGVRDSSRLSAQVGVSGDHRVGRPNRGQEPPLSPETVPWPESCRAGKQHIECRQGTRPARGQRRRPTRRQPPLEDHQVGVGDRPERTKRNAPSRADRHDPVSAAQLRQRASTRRDNRRFRLFDQGQTFVTGTCRPPCRQRRLEPHRIRIPPPGPREKAPLSASGRPLSVSGPCQQEREKLDLGRQARRVRELVSSLTRNQVPACRLRVRVPCPPPQNSTRRQSPRLAGVTFFLTAEGLAA